MNARGRRDGTDTEYIHFFKIQSTGAREHLVLGSEVVSFLQLYLRSGQFS